MNLQMPSSLGEAYSSPTQQARVITESWMADQGYCPSCLSQLTPAQTNFKAVDFACPQCSIQYQLKSTKSKIRQQLQVLRDMGILNHVGRGEWTLPHSPVEAN